MAQIKIKGTHLAVGVGLVLGVVYFANIGGFKDKVKKFMDKGKKKEMTDSTSMIKATTNQPLTPTEKVNMPLAYSGYRTRYHNPRAYGARRTGMFGGIEPSHAYFGATEQSSTGRYNIIPTFEFNYKPYPSP